MCVVAPPTLSGLAGKWELEHVIYFELVPAVAVECGFSVGLQRRGSWVSLDDCYTDYWLRMLKVFCLLPN